MLMDIASFAAAFFFLIITPGPGVLTTAGVGAAYGARAGIRFLTGLFVGTNLVGLGVVTGLAAIVFAVPAVRTVLLVLSVSYLGYLAFRIAFAGSKIAFIKTAKQPGFISGVALQAINPKAYAVNTALFSGFGFMPGSLITEITIKFIIINAIWIPIHILWLWAGTAVQRLDLPPHIQFRINMAMATAMLTVVVLAAFSLW